MPRQGLSRRAAGDLVGASHTAINDAVKNRRIQKLADGSLDQDSVLKWHRERRAYRGKPVRKVSTPRLALSTLAAETMRTVRAQVSAPRECLLTKDGAYSAGVASGLYDMAKNVPLMVAQAALAVGVPLDQARALDAVLRDRVTSAMAALLDEWRVDPYVCAADDEMDHVIQADTWTAHDWPAETLAQVDWAALEGGVAGAKGALP